jgi:hypothetical protein
MSLESLLRRRGGRVRQVTSTGRDSRGRETWLRPRKAKGKRVFIAPGEAHTVADLPGPGVVTRLWITVHPFKPRILRDLVLRCFWDEEPYPSVECPLGGFFGAHFSRRVHYVSACLVIGSGAFTSLWPMPFSEAARVTLTNEGTTAIDPVFYQLTYSDSVPSAADSGLRFHAQWRREAPTRPGIRYTILEAGGSGHYVGCSLAMQNRTWWLRPPLRSIPFPSGFGLGMMEGPVSVYVDGEEKPSVQGTAAEDDFGGAWYNLLGGNRATPGHGCTVCSPLTGRVAVYRFDLQAPLPFRRSLRVEVDHGFDNLIAADYSSVAYWYQEEPHQPYPTLPPSPQRRPSCPVLNLVQATLFLGLPLATVALLAAYLLS